AYTARMEREMNQLDARRALLHARLEALRSTHGEIHGEVRAMAGTALDGSCRNGDAPRGSSAPAR
ncbi:MAG TPA: hypothetical protein VNS22_01890, partial [Geminicoccus sp.]|uniref:hypothetical protein n=1 Tax=Geminicoccus sp. TaxID=2024832 RepID=UPI002BA491A9